MLISDDAARASLSVRWQQHPAWSHAQFAAALGCSQSWVDNWRKRLREEQAGGLPVEQSLQGHSRARRSPPSRTHPVGSEMILSMRDQPPDGLRRVPGQEAIRYYVERDPAVQFFQMPLPSCKTIERLLKAHQRIPEHGKPVQQPLPRPKPLRAWQIDCKEVSRVPADPQGNHQPVVEPLTSLDTGTSVLLDAQVRADCTAETALEALARPLAKYGCPTSLTLDRDPRWVGRPAGSDFPAALGRLGAC